MIDLTREMMLPILDQARLAPTVHNIQPSRWRIINDRLHLLGDPTRSIPVADPTGRDWRISHGTSLEGLALALGRQGLKLRTITRYKSDAVEHSDGYIPIAEMSLVSSESAHLSRQAEQRRVSWRGKFKPVDPETNRALDKFDEQRDDCRLVRARQSISDVSSLADQAGMFFLRDKAHRSELLDWMRLSKSHDRYNIDGLNAAAMNMSAPEAWGAGLVLGPLFSSLDAIGLARPLVSEAAKNRSAAAFVVFHRPAGEDPLDTGRAFYQAWLTMEHFGLSGCPVSVLADWQHSKDALSKRCKLSTDREIISVFRIGKPVKAPSVTHVRLPASALLL